MGRGSSCATPPPGWPVPLAFSPDPRVSGLVPPAGEALHPIQHEHPFVHRVTAVTPGAPGLLGAPHGVTLSPAAWSTHVPAGSLRHRARTGSGPVLRWTSIPR